MYFIVCDLKLLQSTCACTSSHQKKEERIKLKWKWKWNMYKVDTHIECHFDWFNATITALFISIQALDGNEKNNKAHALVPICFEFQFSKWTEWNEMEWIHHFSLMNLGSYSGVFSNLLVFRPCLLWIKLNFIVENFEHESQADLNEFAK